MESVARLTAMRPRGESYSDVILRLVELEAKIGLVSPTFQHAARCRWRRSGIVKGIGYT